MVDSLVGWRTQMKIILLFLCGAIVGTSLDVLQSYNGVAYYTNPLIFKTAWWVPFLFGGGTVAIALSHYKIDPTVPPKTAFFGFFSFLILACSLTAFLKISSLQKGAILLALFFVAWTLWDQNFKRILLALGVAAAGCAIESSLAQLGLYFYAQPDLCEIPYWLPFLYFHVSQSAGFLGRLLLSNSRNSASLPPK